jgi:hypothetical protein
MVNTTENTPAHCHGCTSFDFCRQAQNMMADTPPQQGWVRNSEVYCAGCAGADASEYRIGNGRYGGLSDTPQHCGGCGVPIIHELTPEGIEYVRAELADNDGCCREVWAEVWADYDVQPVIPVIPVNSIMVPPKFKSVYDGWAGSERCMLRAVSSCKGSFTTGTIRPRGCDSSEKWYLSIWRDLASDVDYNVGLASRAGCTEKSDLRDLVEFGIWVDEQVERLEESYGLAEWDPCDDYDI